MTGPPAGDQALLEQVAGGSQAALESLYRTHETRLFRYLVGLTGGNHTLAGEITCETFFEVWKQAATFRGESAVTTWIFSIARHRALSVLRRPRRAAPEEELAHVAAELPDPLERLTDDQAAEQVRRALDTLSSDHREVIELACYHDFSYADIARIMECPVNTVKTRAFHARRHLKQALADLS